MDAPAFARLQAMGQFVVAASLACERLGHFLQHPQMPDGEAELCFGEVANLLMEALTCCERLANLTESQHQQGQASGYGPEDSSALANVQIIFTGFAACAGLISSLEFMMPSETKSAIWGEVCSALREAAKAALRQRDRVRPRPS